MSHALVLLPPVRTAIAAWVRDGYPDETCGLMLGSSRDDRCRITRAVQGRNVVAGRRRDRFELAPEDFLAADREAGRLGLEVVGVWHSHPDHPAEPSATDREFAWPGWSYLIVSVGAGGVRDWRSWRLDGEAFAEEVIEL